MKQIVEFINAGISKVPTTFSFDAGEDIKQFILIYWIIYLSNAVTLGKLTEYISTLLGSPCSQNLVRRMLYCMRLAGWVDVVHYSGQEYYIVLIDVDPFDKYAFRAGAAGNDSKRRKADVASELQSDLALPRYVREAAAKKRSARS